ncbi:EamA family transporter [Paeniglutamicibacter sulfureus]|uniref:EamA family transporter n=1 Tax=Paeniglutamicibacter sulfureus TaxID=43666 RepID=UPI00266682DE|nr:EamA family transporter [Paeniglutamicibacter sulfureus]MDO2934419.1 EamA family transporter [Paeniglutamicibacter sulfureus]
MSHAPASATRSASVGSMMAFAAMGCVQLGLAASIGLAGSLGSEGVAWLRLAWAAVILVAIARPWRLTFSRATLGICGLLGLATAGMTLAFMKAVETIPLGTASALEFMGPLGVAIIQGRGAGRWWALVAAAGVLGLTEPWHGAADLTGVLFALAGAGCWAVYVLLTQRAGDAVDGIGALAISMPVAALAATLVVGPGVIGRMDPQVLAIGFALALLLPVIPFSLELLALRRLTTAAFGTLMCLEPAIAMAVGLIFLHQVPRPAAILGIVLVIVAGIGATRTGRRDPAKLSPTAQDPAATAVAAAQSIR